MDSNSDSAVSPVIGILLMLVVTIIIAAVVSSFAGSMASGSEKAPTLSFTGKYSISNGLSLTHTGGDTVGTRMVNVVVKPGTNFGGATTQYTYEVNKSRITNVTGADKSAWSRTGGGFTSWGPGETVWILPPYHQPMYLTPNITSSCYFNDTKNIGKSVIVEMTDLGGRMFAKTSVQILS